MRGIRGGRESENWLKQDGVREETGSRMDLNQRDVGGVVDKPPPSGSSVSSWVIIYANSQ